MSHLPLTAVFRGAAMLRVSMWPLALAAVVGLASLCANGEATLGALRPEDLRKDAEKASPAVAASLKELARPADELTLADATRVLIAPVTRALPIPVTVPEKVRVLHDPENRKQLSNVRVTAVTYYEAKVLTRVQELLAKPDDAPEAARAAEVILCAVLRFSRSHRAGSEANSDPWPDLQGRLANKLLEVRRQLLKRLDNDDRAEALQAADARLSLVPPDSPLRDDIRALWIRHAEGLLKNGDYAAARRSLTKIEQEFRHSPQADPLRSALRTRAAALLKEVQSQPGSQGIKQLEEAAFLWPRLPELRDELEKRKGTFKTLYVVVPELPEFLSPALAWTDTEKQVLPLLFEPLIDARLDLTLGQDYRPVLAERLPASAAGKRRLTLRRDAFWSDGERCTSADVRHTVQLLTQAELAGRAPEWRDLLEPPRSEGDPYLVDFTYRQGLLDPLAPLGFDILPQHSRGKPLVRADDPDFARQPVGTGPFTYVGRRQEDGRTYAVFRANPFHVRPGPSSTSPLREIRLFAWKDGEAPGKPAPHIALGAGADRAEALGKAGLTDRRALPTRRVYFLGLNHRVPSLADEKVRRAIAHAIDRHDLLKRHYGTDATTSGKQPCTVNGPIPRGSWATAPGVPDELYQPELARTFAAEVKPLLKAVEWTLKYPAGDARLARACEDIAAQVSKRFAEADVHVTIKPLPLPPRHLQEAVIQRDFDFVYHAVEHADQPYALWPLFDPHPDAMGAGGSNFLGYNDTELQGRLRSALHHRHFPSLQPPMQNVHERLYEKMPLVPLWQLPTSVALQPSLRVPALDSSAVFRDVLEWKVAP